jgi:protein-L-isoaspartate(D-aspartate) O-methyltransferase
MHPLVPFLSAVLAAPILVSCGGSPRPRDAGAPDARSAERERMVARQLEARGIADPAVLAALREVPRHLFVPEAYRGEAYDDHPLAIGHEQTISQPYVVAAMTEAAGVVRGERVLEVGTGSGYQAAVLAELGAHVWSIEIVEPLAASATRALEAAGYTDVRVRAGDGYRGWPEHAPFDAILLTAAPDHVPQPLLDQLAGGGRLVLPVGDRNQELLVYERTATGFERRRLFGVRFVPMTGEAEER